MEIESFRELPLMGILRGIETDLIEPLIQEAVMPSGLGAIEITMNTHGAADLIRKAVKVSGRWLSVGAGTVISLDSAKNALDAGATFIVSPTLVREVVDFCTANKIPVFPGALTPQEIHDAWRAGATMVKVFPAKFFGPDYFKEIKGPFGDIELLACGGVTSENLHFYFNCGASAAAFGASVFRKEWLQKRDFTSISYSIKGYISALKNIR